MTRSWFAAVLVMPLALGTFSPAVVSAQDAASLAGRWTLNRELSQFPREAGFNADWLAHANSSGDSAPTPGQSQGGAAGGGNRTNFPVSRVSREDSMRNALLTNEAREPAALLAITDSATEVVITPDKGVARTFHPIGREEVVQTGDVTITATSTREAGRLIVRYKVNQAQELRYTYSRIASPSQLVVEMQFLDRGKGEVIKRVYEPEVAPAAAAPAQAAAPAPAPAAAAAGAPRQEGMPASSARGAAQDYDRQPDAQFKGLSTLGVVVEGLGTQATTCGLRQDAIESAVVKQLSGAGLKVALNADEDTYVYVSVMTATLGNGMCLSRYDATLYTHTTAGLTYHPTPVLVNVSLMHKGSLAAGAAAAHAESVMRGLQEYVGQFTTRIRDANK
jgi:hypothetical protein